MSDTNFKYTLGPWNVAYGDVIGKDNKIVVISSGPAFGNKRTWEDAENNSKLVLASPEMFEALKVIQEIADGSYKHEDDDIITMSFDSDIIDNINTILSKIEG